MVDESALKMAKKECEHGEFSKELRRTVQRLAYGAETSRREQVKEQLADLRDERDEVREERRRKEQQERKLDKKIERKEQELSDLQDTDAEYQGMLESIEADLYQGVRIWEDTTTVKTAANKTGQTPEDVVEDLRERNPDVPDRAFRKSEPQEPSKWKDPNNGYKS